MKRLRSNLILVLAAFIWGAAFSAQSASTDYVGPFTFNAARFIIGGVVLLPVVFITDRLKKQKAADAAPTEGNTGSDDKGLLRHLPAGILCGIILGVASSFQQIGISLGASAGKAGFITALYVILVPIFEVFFGKRGTLFTWISAVLAVAGMYLLTSFEESGLSIGDIMEILCAVAFTLHIIVIDRKTGQLNGVKISCIQFFTAGLLCGTVMLFTETVELASIIDCAIPILYAGIFSCGVAYTLQIVGQKNTQPVVASLLLSLESVFSVITAWIFLGDTMTAREILGCCIVFAAIILAQLPMPGKNK